MAGEIVTKSKRFYCVSIVPDFCRTPIGLSTPPIPYMIIGEFSEATGVSPNITSNGEPVVIHSSTVIPTVKGDEPGIAKGVKSNTVGGRVQAMEKSSTLSFNGERAVRVGDLVYMNDKNTIGRVFERLDASALKAFPKASGPGGTLAVLADAFEARSFIPRALLNLIPGGPLLSAVASAVAGSTRTPDSDGSTISSKPGVGGHVGGAGTQSSTIGRESTPPNGQDGGVSRGRGKDNSAGYGVPKDSANPVHCPVPPRETQYAVVPGLSSQARNSSIEQQVARTNMDAVKMFVEPAAQIGEGAAKIRDGDSLAGLAQIGLGALSVAPVTKFSLLRSAPRLARQGTTGGPTRLSFPKTPAELTNMLGTQPKKVGLTPDGTLRVVWEPNANTRIRFESHPEGLKPGDVGFNPRHHGEHFHIELKPDGVSWNNAQKNGLILNPEPVGYRPGSGKGFLAGEEFPGYQ